MHSHAPCPREHFLFFRIFTANTLFVHKNLFIMLDNFPIRKGG